MNNKVSKGVMVIGLGSMGMGAAKSCIDAGLTVYGVDINSKALNELKNYGAEAVSTDAKDFAQAVDSVLLLVVNASQVKAILFESGLSDVLNSESTIMVSSTISAKDATEIEQRLSEKKLIMLDAPVSGGAAKAAIGEMTVMASGSQVAFDNLKPVLDAVAAKVYNIGPDIGQGSTVKIVHQLLAGVHIAAGAEAMALAARANIPLDTMYDVVTHAAGNSWMFENRMQHVVDGDYSPKSMVDIFVKDLGLVSDTAKDLKFPLHLASQALSMFVSASNMGFGKQDDSAVIKIFPDVDLPRGDK
ncbi:NAD(P)-dependent oxidoreductase [Vibrio sp.]|nr:NAD(P)-dependent oxidoreductase [Vibrio sp.]